MVQDPSLPHNGHCHSFDSRTSVSLTMLKEIFFMSLVALAVIASPDPLPTAGLQARSPPFYKASRSPDVFRFSRALVKRGCDCDQNQICCLNTDGGFLGKLDFGNVRHLATKFIQSRAGCCDEGQVIRL